MEAATIAQVEFTEGSSHAIRSDRAAAPTFSAPSPAAHWEPIWDRLERTLHFRHGKQRHFTRLDKIERVGVFVHLAKCRAIARCLQSEGAARVHGAERGAHRARHIRRSNNAKCVKCYL